MASPILAQTAQAAVLSATSNILAQAITAYLDDVSLFVFCKVHLTLLSISSVVRGFTLYDLNHRYLSLEKIPEIHLCYLSTFSKEWSPYTIHNCHDYYDMNSMMR